MKKLKLFCFPYAGGSSSIYKKWAKYLSPSIELIPIEYAGRGTRFTDPLCKNIDKMVDDTFNTIKKHLDGTDYSFFGHSMGALIAYELNYKLDQLGYYTPAHIFFSGKLAPNIESDYRPIHNLNDSEFKKELLRLGGTPIEALENEDWAKVFLPVLRADFSAVEEYIYTKKPNKLNCDLTILYGEKDYLTINNLEEWKEHTNNKCTFLKFSGGHFFIDKNTAEIVDIINSILIPELEY